MSKPNVTVFFTDQQRWDSTGVHGNPMGLTPNFDRFALSGTHFFNTVTCQPVCAPARSSLHPTARKPTIRFPGIIREAASIGGASARQLPGYYGLIKKLDEALGRIDDALISLDLEENTIVFFTSDHGCHFHTRTRIVGSYSVHGERTMLQSGRADSPAVQSGGCRSEDCRCRETLRGAGDTSRESDECLNFRGLTLKNPTLYK